MFQASFKGHGLEADCSKKSELMASCNSFILSDFFFCFVFFKPNNNPQEQSLFLEHNKSKKVTEKQCNICCKSLNTNLINYYENILMGSWTLNKPSLMQHPVCLTLQQLCTSLISCPAPLYACSSSRIPFASFNTTSTWSHTSRSASVGWASAEDNNNNNSNKVTTGQSWLYLIHIHTGLDIQ